MVLFHIIEIKGAVLDMKCHDTYMYGLLFVACCVLMIVKSELSDCQNLFVRVGCNDIFR